MGSRRNPITIEARRPSCQSPDGPGRFIADVAEWLARAGLIDQRVVDEAKAVETIDAALAWERQRNTDPALADAVAASLAGAGGGGR
jgi:hypothetical protein